ncbi:molybdenum cofactor synthesis domain protein [Methanosalsum zhilinae DSM 4017]|uniref:Molybdenum cofactor synthesis domain protein n=1 Tax=Methanosalsum zhilinae (strain DSM 4017 / NBRC 107636 / OCM 62 / WeN5) TaxID=679901 RepID=F7XMW9_METZD|nr:molybdopterin biosynthesis protein [Methanosalsum zhilinae]AEH59987.1 molybdenum cofactor synthesis domain protein [Methanosalsum zhilinae DSM 4017]
MQRKEFRNLLSIVDAHHLLFSLETKFSSESVLIENAAGSILDEDVVSPIDVPHFDKSVMDGYAVYAADTYGATETDPVTIHLIGSIEPGFSPGLMICSGEAAEISTGAQIPDGADAVVMIEHTTTRDGYVYIYRPVHSGENIMRAGSDILQGEPLLSKGQRIGLRDIGLLAAAGKRRVRVRSLKVGIISTGNEITEPGKELEDGMIYDTNSYALHAAVSDCGGSPVIYGIVEDDEDSMIRILNNAVFECDIVLTSGSTSAGAGDIMYRIIQQKGETFAHGINIRPGKPVVIGRIKDTLTIGLPGNPSSALIIFNEFVAPFIRRTLGLDEDIRRKISAVAGTEIRSEGRHQLLPVGLIRNRIYPADKGSGAVTTLSLADGFIEVGAETEFIEAGTEVEVTMFDGSRTPDLLLAGGTCPGLLILEELTGMEFRILNRSSSGGFSSVASKTADIGCVNMLSKSGEYNVEMMKDMGLENAVLVKGYKRDQGLITGQNTGICQIEDLQGRRLINRNRGSGTRAFFDMQLGRFARDRNMDFSELTASIKGYDSGAKSVLEVCNTITRNFADAGFGIRAAAEENGLGYVSIGEEDFDFIIPEDLLDVPEVRRFIECLSSESFANRLPDGLRVHSRTGEVVNPE